MDTLKLYGEYSRDDVIRHFSPSGGFTEYAAGDVLAAENTRLLFVTIGKPPHESYFAWRSVLQWFAPVEHNDTGLFNFPRELEESAKQRHLFVRQSDNSLYSYSGKFRRIHGNGPYFKSENQPVVIRLELETPLSDELWNQNDWTDAPFIINGMEVPLALKQAVAEGRWKFPPWVYPDQPKFLIRNYIFWSGSLLLPDQMYREAHNKPWVKAICIGDTGPEEMLLFLDYSVSDVPRVTTPGNWGWHVIAENVEEFLPMLEL
jgi:hypothetical protein